jgi:hypothetical protein
MEGLKVLKDLWRPGSWAVRLDLKDAYLHLPLSPRLRPFLAFSCPPLFLRYRALPFGYAPAPRAWTKTMRPVLGVLRSWGVSLTVYLDDLLIIARSPEETLTHLQWTLALLQGLGLSINWAKSQVEPSQRLTFLGFSLDLRSGLIGVPNEKLEKIEKRSSPSWTRAASPSASPRPRWGKSPPYGQRCPGSTFTSRPGST